MNDYINIIVAGTRTFRDYNLLKSKLDYLFQNLDKSKIEIVCGCCDGADTLGMKYAFENHFPVKFFEADWSMGKIAGPIRNEEMAKYADYLVLFWDGKSRGSYNMLLLAQKYNLKTKVIYYLS